MKINFFLPGFFKGIAGGYKVVYQYSNYLACKGHDVHIYYTLKNGENGKHIPKSIACLIRKILSYGYPKWYKLNENISQSAVRCFDKKYIRDADASIATDNSTAYPIYELPKSKGKKFYFIQDYEKWGTKEEFLQATYSLGMNNIVISKWLKEIVDKYSKKESKLIINGIDLDVFKVKNVIKKRKPYTICTLYSNMDRKGCKYGIEIIDMLKKKYPDLKVNMFSSNKRPKELPKWIDYTYKATESQVVELLNQSSIYMCTSLVEGFGLPGLEAMACGCALVTTNCLGVMEYANEENAMISNPKDVQAMYDNIDKLLSNNEFRIELAKKGNKEIQKRSLKFSEEKFEKYIASNKE